MGPMTSRPLTPLADARARLLAGRGPVAAVRLPLAEAIGLTAAETLHAPHALPRTAVALRPGVAVASADLVGATPQAPALLPLAPPHVLIGEALPADADAVLPPDAVAISGPFAEIGQSAYPGENVRKAGGDLVAGTVIVAEGGLITPEVALALGCAGLTTVAVCRPAIHIEGPASPEATFLARLLSEAGCRVAAGTADLVITLVADVATTAPPDAILGLALQPGRDSALDLSGETPRLIAAPRFDGLVALLHGLVLPLVATLAGRRPHRVERALTAKIASQVGMTDLVLLAAAPEGWRPLATGQATLAALLAADAVALIDPDSEGLPAGALLAATPLREPFEPR